MRVDEFVASMNETAPAATLGGLLEALWWDGKGDWARAHALVDDLSTEQGMAVHAYLHRKQGEEANAGYWYRRARRQSFRGTLMEEWTALTRELIAGV